MSDNVTRLPTAINRLWVCQCGCSTFELFEDGTTKCPNCETIRIEGGKWYRKAPEGEETNKNTITVLRTNEEMPEFSRERTRRIAAREDVALIVVALADGSVHTWAVSDDDKQRDWGVQCLDVAKGLIKP